MKCEGIILIQIRAAARMEFRAGDGRYFPVDYNSDY